MTGRGSLNHFERVHRKTEMNGEQNRTRLTLPLSRRLLIERLQCGILATTTSTDLIIATDPRSEVVSVSLCRPRGYRADDHGRKYPLTVAKTPAHMVCHCLGFRRRDLPSTVLSEPALILL